MSNVVQLLSWRFGHYSMIEWGMMLVWFFAYGLTAALLMGLDNQNVTIVNYMIEIVFFYGLFIWIGNFGHLSTQLFHGNPFPYVRRLPIPESALLMARMVLSAGFVFIAAFFSIIIFVLLGDVHVNILSLLVFWLGISLFATALVLTEFRQISPNEFIAKGIIAPLCAVVYVIVGAASFLQGGNTFYIWTIQSIAKMPVIVPLIAMVLGLTVMFGVYRFGKQQIQRKVGAHEITG